MDETPTTEVGLVCHHSSTRCTLVIRQLDLVAQSQYRRLRKRTLVMLPPLALALLQLET
jgi:hypothetical protein